MKFLKSFKEILIILFAAAIVYLFFFRTPETITEEYTVYKYDTIVETKTIPEEKLVIKETEKVEYDTIYIEDYKVAYYELMDSLNTINKYEIILKDDTAAYIDISAQIFANTLYGLDYTFQNRTPTQIITTKNFFNTQELFIGGGTNFNDINISVYYKHDRLLFHGGYDIIHRRPQIGAGYKLWSR